MAGRRSPGPDVLRQKQLVVNLEAVRCLRQDQLRLDVGVHREALARNREHDLLSRRRCDRPHAERLRHLPVRTQRGERFPRGERCWRRLDAGTGRQLARCTAGNWNRPDVAALDVARVRAVVERLAVGRDLHRGLIFNQPIGRREPDWSRVGACDVQRVVTIPFVDGAGRRGRRSVAASPARAASATSPSNVERKHDVVPGEAEIRKRIHERIVRLVVPDLARFAGRYVGLHHRQRVATLECRALKPRHIRDAGRLLIRGTRGTRRTGGAPAPSSRIRLKCRPVCEPNSAAPLLRLLTERQTRAPYEHEAPALVGPHGIRIEVHARRHVLHRPRRHVVDGDKAVIGAGADERDLCSVGRPLRRTLRAPLLDEWLVAAVTRRGGPHRRNLGAIDLPILRIEDGAPIRRERRICGFDDAKRRPSGGPRCPDCALGTVWIRRGIRHPSLAIGRCSPHEHHRRSVVGDLDVGHVDAVVFHEAGEANRRKTGGRRRVGVALALFERNPGDPIDLACGHDLER